MNYNQLPILPWVKLVIVGALALIIGGIFWLGAAYQRFSGMETELIGIHADINQLVKGQMNTQLLMERESDQQRRIDKLEDEVRQLK